MQSSIWSSVSLIDKMFRDLFSIVIYCVVTSTTYWKHILDLKTLEISRRVGRVVKIMHFILKLFLGCKEDFLFKIIARYPTSEAAPVIQKWGEIKSVYINRFSDLQIVLNSPAALEKARYYTFFKEATGEGLFTAPVDKWKKHRRLISPTFNNIFIANFIPIFNKKNKEFVEKLKAAGISGQTIDFWHYIEQLNLDTIFATMMNCDAGTVLTENDKKEFLDSVTQMSRLIYRRLIQPLLHPELIFKIYSAKSRLHKHIACLKRVSKQIIQYKKSTIGERQSQEEEYSIETEYEVKHNRPKTFLHNLIRLNEQGANFSDQDLQDEVVTMMIAGSETSAVTICFTLLMLAMNPQIQDKVYKEVIELTSTKESIEMEDVHNMLFLDQCVKETLRLFPVGPIFSREATDDFKLSDGFLVKKGMNILISPFLVHRDPNIYKNPKVWNPDNFSPEELSKRHKLSFFPFSSGPRACIGAKYAMLSMKITIASVLKNFYLTTDLKMADIKLTADIVLRCKNGYQIQLHSR